MNRRTGDDAAHDGALADTGAGEERNALSKPDGGESVDRGDARPHWAADVAPVRRRRRGVFHPDDMRPTSTGGIRAAPTVDRLAQERVADERAHTRPDARRSIARTELSPRIKRCALCHVALDGAHLNQGGARSRLNGDD